MKCPNCDADMKKGAEAMRVTDMRHTAGAIRRRRICLACNHKFSTLETVVLDSKGGRPLRLPDTDRTQADLNYLGEHLLLLYSRTQKMSGYATENLGMLPRLQL